jgi:hypothetical protein
LNNRAENSHLPIRKREKLMQGFRSWGFKFWGSLQRFLAAFSAVRNLFVPARQKSSAFDRHLLTGTCTASAPSLRGDRRPAFLPETLTPATVAVVTS